LAYFIDYDFCFLDSISVILSCFTRMSTMLFRTSHSKVKGFTLIETLVAVVILGILAAIVAPSFMTWLNNKKVEDITTSVEGAITEAKLTAGRKNKSCSILITSTTASVNGSTFAGCLPSGTRTIQGSNTNIAVVGTDGSSGTTVTFTYVGNTIDTKAFIIYRTDAPAVGKRNCIVITSGIGAIKTGTYTGPLSSPPTAAQISNIASLCTVN
jgi:prepilin-type N-terminal cleavage/methylation domain-containing protein